MPDRWQRQPSAATSPHETYEPDGCPWIRPEAGIIPYMAYRLVNVAPDPNAKPFSLFDWLSGYKTYAVTIVGVAKVWYVAVYGHPWSDNIDNAINITLLLL